MAAVHADAGQQQVFATGAMGASNSSAAATAAARSPARSATVGPIPRHTWSGTAVPGSQTATVVRRSAV
ncbi:hypothetical protein [Blastococcus sp. SYSU DS0533]